jgi:hypothetical protein
MLLVVDEGTFKRLASRSPVRGEDVYSASFSMTSTRSHWRPYLVERERLAERLLGEPVPASASWSLEEPEGEPIDRYSHWLGFLGESEVINRLCRNTNLDLFRPFPDLEMVEVLVRNRVTGHFLGLQVKTGVPTGPYGEAQITIRKATFEPAASTFVVALAWLAEQQRFANECLVIPTTHLVEIAVGDTDHLVLNFHPNSQERTPLDPYRRPLADLGQLAETSSAL